MFRLLFWYYPQLLYQAGLKNANIQSVLSDRVIAFEIRLSLMDDCLLAWRGMVLAPYRFGSGMENTERRINKEHKGFV